MDDSDVFVVILVPCQSDICLKKMSPDCKGLTCEFFTTIPEGSRHRCNLVPTQRLTGSLLHLFRRWFNFWCTVSWVLHATALGGFGTEPPRIMVNHTSHLVRLFSMQAPCQQSQDSFACEGLRFSCGGEKNKERRVLRVHSQVIFASYHLPWA